MSQARRIQRAQRSRVGELVSHHAKVAPVDRNVLAFVRSLHDGDDAVVEEARAYQPKLPQRVATFGYVLLVTFLVAWALAAVAEGLR